MPVLAVVNKKNENVGEVTLNDDVFGVPVKPHILQIIVRKHLAEKRAGNAKTKVRSEIRGGGAKPFRQKGTGRARQGSSRSPLMVGGGRVFGPSPRDYGFRLNKKLMKLGLKMALSMKAANDKVKVVDDLSFEAPKTKALIECMKAWGVEKALFVDEKNGNLLLSSRNLGSVKYLSSPGVNVYDLLKYDTVIIAKEAVEKISERLA